MPEDPQAWQKPILQGIWTELIKLLPPHWNAATLILGAPPHGLGSGVTHTITSPEDRVDVVLPSMMLFQFTRQLELGCKERNWLWKRVLISVTKKNGKWSVGLNYEY
jgi:hypothetical protein